MIGGFLRTDVFVVGGGPAGLATAIALAQRGFRVTTADAAHPPIDKACGEGLMPDSLAALARLGVTITDGAAVPLRGIRFIDSISSVEAPFPNGCGVGIRRTALHQLLVEGAREAGVEMLWNTRVRAVLPGRVTAGSSVWECRWTVAADGENSRVRRWMKLDRRRHERVRFGFRRHYRVKRWTDLVEVYWSHGCQMVITPIDADEVCVAITTPNSRLRLQAALKLFPQAARHLEGADANTPEKGAVSALRRLRAVSRGSFALVGDASGSVDAITGEGLCQTFRQAVVLADAMARGDLGLYDAAHRRLARWPRLMSRAMLMMDRHPGLRQRVLQMLSAKPAVFQMLVAAQVSF